MTLHTVESIRTRSGGPHERQSRRKGHRVRIDNLTLGERMILVYVDDNAKFLMTSPVVNVWDEAGNLVVVTRNSEYTFRKFTEVAEC